MRKMTNSKSILFLSVLITMSLTACNLNLNTDAMFEKTLLQAANEQNKSLPMMVDKDTRWDSNIVGPGKSWTYMYTLVSPEAKSITNEKINGFLGPRIRNSVCTMKEMEIFVNNGVSMKYLYRDNEGKVVGEVVFNAGDCKK